MMQKVYIAKIKVNAKINISNYVKGTKNDTKIDGQTYKKFQVLSV